MNTYRQLLDTPMCPLNRFYHNPYHFAGSVLAKLIVNGATFLWASIVLWKDNALVESGSRYAFITESINEDYLAMLFGLVAIVQTVCLWSHKEPTLLRNVGYAVLSLAWGFVFFTIAFRAGPIQPTSFACSGMVALVALYAFLDGKPEPRRDKSD